MRRTLHRQHIAREIFDLLVSGATYPIDDIQSHVLTSDSSHFYSSRAFNAAIRILRDARYIEERPPMRRDLYRRPRYRWVGPPPPGVTVIRGIIDRFA